MSHLRVIVVGAGFSGLAMGARLRQEGIEDFLILEKAEDVGGTWRDNRYPGCACDVPSRLYSLSFAPKTDWSRDFAPAAEIWDYLRDCVDRFALRPHLVLGADVTSATWEGDRWRVIVADGREWTAQGLVLGVGGLHVPRRPDIAGLANFAGAVVHTADWPADDGLDGLRVGVVGTGASAVQLVPALADRVGELVVFQRTPSWILPRGDRAWSPGSRQGYRRIPAVARLMRWRTFAKLESRLLGFGRLERARRAVERQALARLAEAVPDPATRAALTPDYALGCKRVLLSDDYWPTFARADVRLVCAPITRVDPHALVSLDGASHEVDALVLATGFDLQGSFLRIDIRGVGGRRLAEDWADGRSTHLGIEVAGFPELYLLLGPNTALGHNSVLLMIESAIEHILAGLRRAQNAGPHTVTRDAQDRFGRWVAARTRHTVWGSGCQSWYLDERGRNIAIWPASTIRYRLATRWLRERDYEPVRPAPRRRPGD
ncbi:MAG: NAD(P)/FAD-dependent oxidoreductase [Actinomycetales bacterium]|nr:NAD(P)/FAD-dependent oxidoreductase [Actinomycetales bacterium]